MESTDSSSGSQQPQLPPGFRFHPTDEELVVHYLRKKAADAPLPVSIIAEVDLYKFDPWELPAKAIFGDQEWYFFSPRDRKYPNGARPNRAATSGYWKATGTDKPVLTAGGTQKAGVKKALVFYGGKPPKGIKTSWIMHEYRLADTKPVTKPDFTNKKHSLRLDDWVLCRIYKKNTVQRPVDMEGSDLNLNDVIGPIIPPGLSFGLGQQHEYEMSMMNQAMNSGSKSGVNMMGGGGLVPMKRTNLYWNDDHRNSTSASTSTRMFMSERNEDQYQAAAGCNINILSHLPHQTTSLSIQQQQEQDEEAMMGSMGDGVFEQQQGYQMTTWYT